MGDMTDMYDYLLDEETDYVAAYFEEGPEWLVTNSAASRKPIVMSIRRHWIDNKKMSVKQQWVLAFWVAERDMYYA
jgi:hypothetical protein